MLSTELIQRIRRIELHAGHMVSEALAGEYLSAFRGQGIEFDEVREYHPGDDVRLIDWNVTARMNQPFVKVFREEREMTMMLLVDASPSQFYGSGRRSKQEVAAELAAVLAFLAIRNNDKVGLTVFSDHVETFVPPKKGRGHVWQIIRSVMSHEGRGAGTDIGGALDYAQRVLHRRASVFVISDFLTPGYEHSLRLMARRHDLVCARVYDPAERALPAAGIMLARDLEQGELRLVNTSRRAVRHSYEQQVAAYEGKLNDLVRAQRVGFLDIDVTQDLIGPIERFFRERRRRRRR